MSKRPSLRRLLAVLSARERLRVDRLFRLLKVNTRVDRATVELVKDQLRALYRAGFLRVGMRDDRAVFLFPTVAGIAASRLGLSDRQLGELVERQGADRGLRQQL